MDGTIDTSGIAAPPRATGGPVALPRTSFRSDESIRRDAMEYAIKAGRSTQATILVGEAHAIEQYLKNGGDGRIPAPLQPPLPLHFARIAAGAPDGTLYAIQRVLEERRRQVAKGHDAAHDDTRTSEELADQAAAAILGGTRFLSGADAFTPWIDYHGQERTAVLVKGIALAVAELERIHRANDRANTAERRSSMKPADLAAEDGAKAMYADHVRESEGLPPIGQVERLELVLPGKLTVNAGAGFPNEITVNAGNGFPDGFPAIDPKDAKLVTRQTFAPIGDITERIADGVAALEEEVEPMTLADFGKMHHALGNPRDVLAETHRNHYAANLKGEIAPRLRMFPKFWEEDSRQPPKSAMAFFSVTDAGRHALAKAMQDNPEHFPIYLENVTPKADPETSE